MNWKILLQVRDHSCGPERISMAGTWERDNELSCWVKFGELFSWPLGCSLATLWHGIAAVYNSEVLYCLPDNISVNSTCRFLSPSVTNSQIKLAALRTGFFLKPKRSSSRITQNFLNRGTLQFQSHPKAGGYRAVGITALLSETAVLQWTFRVYQVRTEKLQNYKPATRHIKISTCKIAFLIDLLCLLPSQPFVFAGLQTFLQLKTRKLTVAFRSVLPVIFTELLM